MTSSTRQVSQMNERSTTPDFHSHQARWAPFEESTTTDAPASSSAARYSAAAASAHRGSSALGSGSHGAYRRHPRVGDSSMSGRASISIEPSRRATPVQYGHSSSGRRQPHVRGAT